jgi:hypothetical protein
LCNTNETTTTTTNCCAAVWEFIFCTTASVWKISGHGGASSSLTVDACMYACMLILFLLAKTINETTTTTTTIAGAVPDSSAACDFMETRTEQNVIITRTKTNCAAV